MRAPLPSSPWLTCPRIDPAAPLRLWCVPFAGGGAAVWHPWAAKLAGLAEVIALRLPGRENRLAEVPLVNLFAVISALLDLIAPFACEDYVLCGHSLGGLIVYELARAIRAQGLRPPLGLIVSGVRAPHHPPDRPHLHTLPRDEFIAEVERRYGAIPPEIRDAPEIMDLLLPVLRADLQVYETHRHVPSAPLAIPLLALGGEGDANVSPAQLLDWRGYASARFEAALLPGGHFFLQENLAPTIARVRDFLETCIERPAATGGRPAAPVPWGRGNAPVESPRFGQPVR